jgi:beta-lactamase class A
MDVKIDRRLQTHIEGLVKGFPGEVGIYVKNLRNGTIASVRADELFPTASIVKIPILIGIADKLDKHELDYHQKLTYTDDLLYEGEDILGSFKTKEKIELSKLIMLMLTTSDNTASLWLQALAGEAGGGFILRTNAEDASDAQLGEDISGERKSRTELIINRSCQAFPAYRISYRLASALPKALSKEGQASLRTFDDLKGSDFHRMMADL